MGGDIEEWEQQTGRSLADEPLLIEYAVPKDGCRSCRTNFGSHREGAERHAREHGGAVEMRLVTVWRAA